MPFFNRTIVTKKLWNIIYIFFGKLYKLCGGFFCLDVLIVQRIQRNCKKVFLMVLSCFFLVQNNFPRERGDWLGFIIFKE